MAIDDVFASPIDRTRRRATRSAAAVDGNDQQPWAAINWVLPGKRTDRNRDWGRPTVRINRRCVRQHVLICEIQEYRPFNGLNGRWWGWDRLVRDQVEGRLTGGDQCAFLSGAAQFLFQVKCSAKIENAHGKYGQQRNTNRKLGNLRTA